MPVVRLYIRQADNTFNVDPMNVDECTEHNTTESGLLGAETRKQVAAVLTEKSSITAASYRIALSNTIYSLYFTRGRDTLKFPIPLGDPSPT